jgi:ppGpp synthetase/RelA/SpoT-type nucleotidyltranferase
LDPVDAFLARYVKEYDYYDQTARIAARMLESNLQAAGVRCIVTSRAKSVTRLGDKCRQRNKQRPYESIDDIYSDIVDLAGVRVALYFPREREQVGSVISRLFHEYEPRRVFGGISTSSPTKRFSGYSALHYRVRLQPNDLGESDQRYASANIEIQVASVLMHAWAEVDHDLVYKPSEGELSEEEYSLLDQLNGLVLAGEISLERLQTAGEARVAVGSRQFANHYELAAHLLSRASRVNEGEVSDSGLGRIDLLFKLLTRLELNTPDDLAPFLQRLHGDLERRPLSEQIIDALVIEDQERYETYLSIRAEASRADRRPFDESSMGNLDVFLAQWVRLERLAHELVGDRSKPSQRRSSPISLLARMPLLDSDMRAQLDTLRNLRNELVHGYEVPPPRALDEATERLIRLINQIEHRRDAQESQEQEGLLESL